MKFSLSIVLSLLPCLLSTASAAAAPAPVADSNTNNPEYYALGCPKSTKPYASTDQQLSALNDFTHKLFDLNNASLAFGDHVAEKLINHAPDAAGDGTAAAEAAIAPMLGSAYEVVMATSVGQDRGHVFFRAGDQGQPPAIISMEMFRMIGTCFVEHWITVTLIKPSNNTKAYY
ncbi:MAG: hypothetical protein MMC23_005175 [Stictis urceolatum]|nr:hypothetical protein [Stictis urceolata]